MLIFFLKEIIFDHENMKKPHSKVAHNSQPSFFFITGLAAQKAHFRQKYEFYRLSVSPLYNLLAEALMFFQACGILSDSRSTFMKYVH